MLFERDRLVLQQTNVWTCSPMLCIFSWAGQQQRLGRRGHRGKTDGCILLIRLGIYSKCHHEPMRHRSPKANLHHKANEDQAARQRSTTIYPHLKHTLLRMPSSGQLHLRQHTSKMLQSVTRQHKELCLSCNTILQFPSPFRHGSLSK